MSNYLNKQLKPVAAPIKHKYVRKTAKGFTVKCPNNPIMVYKTLQEALDYRLRIIGNNPDKPTSKAKKVSRAKVKLDEFNSYIVDLCSRRGKYDTVWNDRIALMRQQAASTGLKRNAFDALVSLLEVSHIPWSKDDVAEQKKFFSSKKDTETTRSKEQITALLGEGVKPSIWPI
jgi:hypothetical protein